MGERRPVGEIVLLALVLTLCTILVVAVVGGVVIAALSPLEDLSALQTWLQNTSSTLIGLLIGIVAGRTNAARRRLDD